MILIVFAMFLVQALTIYVSEAGDDVDPEFRREFDKWFGSVFTTMITLFQCVSGGENWALPYKTVATTSTINAGVFIFFIFFFLIAVWNIVTAIFIERAMEF